MPKVVSNSLSIISDPRAKEKHSLFVYYCICGEYCLILDAYLESMPRRKTDLSYIVKHAVHTSKTNLAERSPVYIKRSEGFEKQHRLHCKRCNLLVAYRVDQTKTAIHPEPSSAKITFFLSGSLVRTHTDAMLAVEDAEQERANLLVSKGKAKLDKIRDDNYYGATENEEEISLNLDQESEGAAMETSASSELESSSSSSSVPSSSSSSSAKQQDSEHQRKRPQENNNEEISIDFEDAAVSSRPQESDSRESKRHREN